MRGKLLCQAHQVRIAAREDGRAQHLRQREVGERGDQEQQQCLHVFRFQRVEQAAAPRADEGDVFRAQRFFIYCEVGAAAHQHHDVAITCTAFLALLRFFILHVHDPIADDGLQQLRELHGFLVARAFFGLVASV